MGSNGGGIGRDGATTAKTENKNTDFVIKF